MICFTGLLIHAQNSNDVINERARELDAVRRMRNETRSVAKQSATALDTLDDDQIISAKYLEFDPPAQARKAAERAERLSRKGRHEEAIDGFRTALGLAPGYYEAENNLAIEYYISDKPDLAIETLKHLTHSVPNHVFVFNNLGTMLCQLHRYLEAEAVAREALKTHPYSFKAHFVLGSSLVSQGKRSLEARKDLEFASVTCPEANVILADWPAPKTN